MNNFKKLNDLQDSLKSKGYKRGQRISKQDYIESLNTTFGLNAKIKDIHKSF